MVTCTSGITLDSQSFGETGLEYVIILMHSELLSAHGPSDDFDQH